MDQQIEFGECFLPPSSVSFVFPSPQKSNFTCGIVRLCNLDLSLREECRPRAFKKRVLKRIFGSKWEEVVGGWRRLHNEELHNLLASSIVVKVFKSRRKIWAVHVESMEEMINYNKILVGKRREHHSQDLGVGKKIILEWILGS